jgi:phosphoenolpyruvate---glycerone phosphotransferase subunit DhaL
VNPARLRALLIEAMTGLEDARDELRDLDAAIGDGDLGITVGGGASAVAAALAADASVSAADVLRAAARAFARANPSTMSGLAAAALLAAARDLAGRTELDRAAAVQLLDSAVAAIAQRGGAELGDKTVLDAMAPSLDALRSAPAQTDAALAEMIRAAQTGVDRTRDQQSRRGRAAWLRERSAGCADPGATAYVRLLESLARAWPSAADVAEPVTASRPDLPDPQ